MSALHAPPEGTPATPYSHDQLHARACIACGRTDCVLTAAGYVLVENRPGQHLTWPVAVCPDDLGWEAPC